MKISALRPVHILSLLLLAALACGCATPALWKQTAAREWKPWPPDELLLIHTTNQPPEIAVVCSQFTAGKMNREFRPVAWFLGHSPTNLVIGTAAITQFTNSLTAPQKIPLFTDAIPADVSAAPPGYAVWNSTNRDLTLHLDGYASNPYPLPSTRTEQRTALRVIVLPFAVVADAAIALVVIMSMGGAGVAP